MENSEKRYVSLLETAMCLSKGDNSSSSNTESTSSSSGSRICRRKHHRKHCKKHSNNGRHSVGFKELSSTPLGLSGRLYPLNHAEQKERFLRYGLVPDFNLRAVRGRRKQLSINRRAVIRFEHYADACRILDAVRDRFGDGSAYLYEAFGPRISRDEASEILAQYISEHNLDRKMTVYWTPELTCSARMVWRGPHRKKLRPEDRRCTLIIKSSSENQYLRQKAVRCLADHEIGTHFFRMHNEGFQPWYGDRVRFNLRGTTTRQYFATEEGLAAVNTMLNANYKYLWMPAILYYTACRATQLTFKELYDDLEQYIGDTEQRWKHVMRVKRYHTDNDGLGGYGGDQCYLEGALSLLRNVETIDWPALYSGEICMDEIQRVRRVARRDIISLPTFLSDVENYRKQLRQIAAINGLESAQCVPTPANVELVLPTAPRSRQRITAKMTVDPGPRRASTAVPPSLPAVTADVADAGKLEEIARGKDKLRITGSAVQVTSFQLASSVSKRLSKYKQSASDDSVRQAFRRLNAAIYSDKILNRR